MSLRPQWSPPLSSGMTPGVKISRITQLAAPQWSPPLSSGMTGNLLYQVCRTAEPQWSPPLSSGMTSRVPHP